MGLSGLSRRQRGGLELVSGCAFPGAGGLPSSMSGPAAWAIRPADRYVLWRKLLALDDMCNVHQPLGCLGRRLHVFSDGSCLLPTDSELRLASWAVTLAVPVGSPACIIASAPVHGLIQTAFRAELMAALSALLFAIKVEAALVLYCDCRGVVGRVLRFLSGSPCPTL